MSGWVVVLSPQQGIQKGRQVPERSALLSHCPQQGSSRVSWPDFCAHSLLPLLHEHGSCLSPKGQRLPGSRIGDKARPPAASHTGPHSRPPTPPKSMGTTDRRLVKAGIEAGRKCRMSFASGDGVGEKRVGAGACAVQGWLLPPRSAGADAQGRWVTDGGRVEGVCRREWG